MLTALARRDPYLIVRRIVPDGVHNNNPPPTILVPQSIDWIAFAVACFPVKPCIMTRVLLLSIRFFLVDS